MRVVMDGWLFTWVRGSVVRWALQCLEGWPRPGSGGTVVIVVPHEGAQYVPSDLGPGIELVVGAPQISSSYIERRIEWDQRIVPALFDRVGGDVFYNAAMTAPLESPLPSCIVIHDLYFLENPWGRSGDFYRQWVLPSLERAERVCVPSPLVARQVAARLGVASERVRVTPPDLGSDFHPKSAAEAAEDLRPLGLDPGYVLFVGDLIPRKRVPFLLEAMAAEALRGVPTVIVGGGREPSEDIAARVAALPRGSVHFLPWVSDPVLSSLYCGASVTALPAKWEGFCYPAFESAACGTPAVVDRGTPAAETGFPGIISVDADDPVVFAAAVADARRSRLSGAQQTWPRLAESTWQVLGECVR